MPTQEQDYDEDAMFGQVLLSSGVFVFVERLILAEQVWTALYGRRESPGEAAAGSSAGGCQDVGINVEQEEEWDSSDIPMESDIGVPTGLQAGFNAICVRC